MTGSLAQFTRIHTKPRTRFAPGQMLQAETHFSILPRRGIRVLPLNSSDSASFEHDMPRPVSVADVLALVRRSGLVPEERLGRFLDLLRETGMDASRAGGTAVA